MTYREIKNMKITRTIELTSKEVKEAIYAYLRDTKDMERELPETEGGLDLHPCPSTEFTAENPIFLEITWEEER